MFGNDALVLLARVKRSSGVAWSIGIPFSWKRRRGSAKPSCSTGSASSSSLRSTASASSRRSSGRSLQDHRGIPVELLRDGQEGEDPAPEVRAGPGSTRGRLIWLTLQLTARTGVTMRELRFRRFVWANYKRMMLVGGDWIGTARALAELQRENGGSDWTREERLKLLSQRGVERALL